MENSPPINLNSSTSATNLSTNNDNNNNNNNNHQNEANEQRPSLGLETTPPSRPFIPTSSMGTTPTSTLSHASHTTSSLKQQRKPSSLPIKTTNSSSSASLSMSSSVQSARKKVAPLLHTEPFNPTSVPKTTSSHSLTNSSMSSSRPASLHTVPPSMAALSKSSLNFDATSSIPRQGTSSSSSSSSSTPNPTPSTPNPYSSSHLHQEPRPPTTSISSLPFVSPLHDNDSSDEDTASVPLMALPTAGLREVVSQDSLTSDEVDPQAQEEEDDNDDNDATPVPNDLRPLPSPPPTHPAPLRASAHLLDPPSPSLAMSLPTPTSPPDVSPSTLPLLYADHLKAKRCSQASTSGTTRSLSTRPSKISAYTLQLRPLRATPAPRTFHDPTLSKLSKSLRSLKSVQSHTSSGHDTGGSVTAQGAGTKPRKKKARLQVANERASMGWCWFLVHSTVVRVHRWYGAHTWVMWSESVKLMEGRFGTGVASYFILARWVVTLNVVLGLVWLVAMGVGVWSLVHDPWDGERWWEVQGGGWLWLLSAFFTGTEAWVETPLFYAFYKPRMVGRTVLMDLAYIGTVFAVIFLSFAFLIVKIRGEFVNKSGLSTGIGVDEVYPFSAVVFASWNHAIDTPHVKKNLSFAISTVLKTLISRYELQVGSGMTWQDHLALLFRRCGTNLLCTVCLGGAGWVIYDSVRACESITNTFLFRWVAIFSQKEVTLCTSSKQPTPFAPYLVSVFNVILPGIFSSVARFEKYKDPQWETRATLARSYLIKVASIYLMLFSLSGLVLESTDTTFCWEHEVAKRFYSLQWLDLTLTCITTVLSALFVKSIWGTYQFDITSNILELVYRQSITWIGSIYAPIMPWVGMFSTTVIFFIKKWTVQRYADPPRRIYNSYSQVIWFLLFMLLTLILMMLPALFVLTLVQPSKKCGPYRSDPNYPITFSSGEGAYQVIIKSIANMQDTGLKTTLNALGSVAVIAPVIGFLMLWVYFLLAVAEKRNKRLNALEEEVLEEREDKRNLIRFYGVQL